MLNSHGLLLYCSQRSVKDLPQVMIILHSSQEDSLAGQNGLLRSQTLEIPPGRVFSIKILHPAEPVY